jgi:hypothetical protein
VKRSAAESAGTAEPGSDLRRASTIRTVALAVLGAAVLVLNSAYHAKAVSGFAVHTGLGYSSREEPST